jgi:hypothetical protein
MLGIIIAVICSNWVGEAINSDGIYETDLEADGTVIFLRPSPPHTLYTKTAADIAARAVWWGSGFWGPRQLSCSISRTKGELLKIPLRWSPSPVQSLLLSCGAPLSRTDAQSVLSFQVLQIARAGASER